MKKSAETLVRGDKIFVIRTNCTQETVTVQNVEQTPFGKLRSVRTNQIRINYRTASGIKESADCDKDCIVELL